MHVATIGAGARTPQVCAAVAIAGSLAVVFLFASQDFNGASLSEIERFSV